MDKMDRRKFLKVSGSLAVGGIILSAAGNGMWKMFTHPEKLFHDSGTDKSSDLLNEDKDFVSPYRRTFGFLTPDDICGFDTDGGSIFIATNDKILVYGMSGEVQNEFGISKEVRDIAVYERKVYVLYPTKIEVYDLSGARTKAWDACSGNSDYCSLAVCGSGVFVTDAGEKVICKYSLDGTLARFITSPKGFVVPSYSFGITAALGRIFCSNPGHHLVEEYTEDGEYVQSFGKTGAQPGAFSGCCNPVIITPTNNGELLTSEKGIPRICCYGTDGTFHGMLLDAEALGGGHKAYDVRIQKDKLIVACDRKVAIYQYNRNVSKNTACATCNRECALKVTL